jgi:hypothetical protein
VFFKANKNLLTLAWYIIEFIMTVKSLMIQAPGKPFQTNLKFVGKPRLYLLLYVLTVLENIVFCRKGLRGTNTLAYLSGSSMTEKKINAIETRLAVQVAESVQTREKTTLNLGDSLIDINDLA